MKVLKVLALCLCLSALPLAASDMDWSMIGSGGEIDESCLTLYEYTGARLHFKSGQTGTITVRYPVTAYGNANSLQPPWDVLRLTAVDNSASGSVTARLISVDECSGEEEELCSVTGGGATPTCAVCIFPPDIDFELFSYYVEGTVARSSTSADEQLVVVSLGH
ncbi:MAG TPA: hypothetical protein VFP80_12575 [Thermoanaerobaculia bacterium]|nr:hypothetical protein [Thermoanaerobaculia bacterium]